MFELGLIAKWDFACWRAEARAFQGKGQPWQGAWRGEGGLERGRAWAAMLGPTCKDAAMPGKDYEQNIHMVLSDHVAEKCNSKLFSTIMLHLVMYKM